MKHIVFLTALALVVAAGGCATTPQNLLILGGAAYVAAGLDLTGGNPALEAPEYEAAVAAGEACARLVARGDVDDSECTRTGGWDERTGTYIFGFTYDISDRAPGRAEFAVVVEPAGMARLDVRFNDDQYVTCEDGALKGPSIAVGPRAAALTAVEAEPIEDPCQLSVRLAAAPEHGFPIWLVERLQAGEPGIIVFCEVDALTGDVLRQGRRTVRRPVDASEMRYFGPAERG